MIKKILPLILLLALTLAPLRASAQEGDPESPEAPLAWSRVAVNGFGVSSNDTVWSLAEYKGQLYAGTRNPSLGAQMWRTSNGATWTLAQSGGLGDAHNTAIPSMKGFLDNLYLGTENGADGAEVWRTDGATWTQVNTNGFGNANNDVAWTLAGGHLGPPSDPLYVGTLNNTNGVNVWEFSSGTWKPHSTNGIGDVHNTVATSMSYYYGVYVGTWNQVTGGQVWLYDYNLNTWTPLNTDGFGDANNWSARSMLAFKNAIFIGTFNPVEGAQVWCYEGGWMNLAFNGFGDSHNVGISSLFAYGEYIYAGTENSTTGAEIWRSKDGFAWEQVNTDGFGSPNNGEATALAGFGPYLFAGTRNFVTGGEVWRVNLLGADQSFLINSKSVSEGNVNIAFNSQNREYLVSWDNWNPGLYDDDLQAQRITWDGRLTGSPFWISTGPGAERYCPAAAYDSVHNRYLIVWHSDEGSSTFKFYARLFSASGGALANEFEIPANNQAWGCPNVVYWPEANGYLVIFATYNSPLDQASVFGQLVTSSGALGVAWSQRQNVPGFIHGNNLAYNPARGEVLMFWSEGTAGRLDVYGEGWTYTASLDRLESPDAPFLISSGAGDREDSYPSAAALSYPSGSGQYLVAWSHRNSSGVGTEIQTRRVSGEGVPLGSSLSISSAITNGREEPEVIGLPLSRRFQVVWYQGPTHELSGSYGSALYGRQVDSAGNALGSPLYVGGSNATSLGLARGPGDTYLVVFDDIPMGNIYRQVRGRLFGVRRIYLPLIRR